MIRRAGIAFMAAAMAVIMSGCATTSAGDPETRSWREVNQTGNRFAVFVNEPGAARAGDRVTFRLRYVYLPGEVKHEEREVAWQEYHAATVDCAANTIRLGARTRYAPDGATIMSDENTTFSDILVGTAADDAARAKCRNDVWAGDVVFANGDRWMDAARKHIAETEPPKRTFN